MANEPLKDCPFCGGSAELSEVAGEMPRFWPVVGCAECGSRTPAQRTEAEAIAAWNTRAAEPAADVVGLLLQARSLLANSGAESGYCMCGDPVESHTVSSGHAPVDTHGYMASQLVESIDAALQAQPAEPSEAEVRDQLRHENDCLQARIAQLEYPCSPYCDGYLREMALRRDLEAIRAAMRRYLKPDSGITAEEFASEVIGIVDGRGK